MYPPLVLAKDLVIKHAPAGADRDAALAALDRLVADVPHTDRRTCRECGRFFELSEEARAFFVTRALHLPSHCPDCRVRRKRSALRDEASA